MLEPGFEVLIDRQAYPHRADRFMSALADARPADAKVTQGYESKRRVLMVYGPGALWRLPIIEQHKARGGRVLMWDLGYWDRERSMRLSVDRLHPTADHLALAPEGSRREFVLREDASESGPVLLVGLGPKSVAAYETGEPLQWERKALKRLRARDPMRTICWRPKGHRPTQLAGLPMRFGMPIEEALKGCSLVVCRHSNVAVDACIAGVPVECEDGAAWALYRDNPKPTPAARAEFLRRLSWFEWSRAEAAEAWQFCRRLVQ